MQPLRIAILTRRYPPLIGGAEKVISYLAAALAAEGADVSVLTSRMPGLGLPAREEIPIADAGRLTVERLETSRLRFVGTWLYMRHLRRWFDRNPVDLAYVSMLKHDAYVAVEAGRRLGFPVVLRPEGAGATGDIAWQSWGRFGHRIGRRCRDASAFVAISKAVEAELTEAWHHGTMRGPSSGEPRIIAIPNGVPVPAQAWQRRPGWRDEPRAAFVGRLAPEKGLDTLIDAWPIVRASFPEARLTLIGEGPERPMLEARVSALGLNESVAMPGALADPTAALRDADLFVLPSREEGMSIALLEAMALGIPVVASSIPGNLRIVVDFQHGRLAPVDDPHGLAQIIVEQWTYFDRAFHMSRAARSRVEEEFSIRSMARQHLALFSELIEEARSGRSRAEG